MSFVNCIYHIVFATSRREKCIIHDKEREVYAIIYHILTKNGCHVYRIGDMPDHIHILADIPPTESPSSIIQKIKRESSLAINYQRLLPGWHGWQKGYGCFSYSRHDIPQISHYISTPKEHHKHISFIDEYRAWLIDNGVSPDAPFFPK